MELTPLQQRLVDYVREHPGQLVVTTLGFLSMNQKEFWNNVSILCERGVLEKRVIEGRKHEGLWVV